MQKKQSLLKQFFHFSAATVASLMVFSLYSIVDGLFVARGVGEYAMTAVNLSVPFVNLLFSIAVIFAVGTSTIIAYLLGQKNAQSANKLFSQNLATLVVIGVTISVLVLAFTEPLARLLGAEEVTLEYTIHYLQGLAPFAVCFMISYNLEVLVKTDGRPRLALVTVCVGCVTNCVLDYLAIFHWGLGIWGAAAATGLSQLLTCIIYLTHFLGKHTTFHPVRFRMDWKIYRRLLPIGISDGLTELCNGLMIFLFNHTILRCIGTDGLVAYTIIAYANTLVINITMGVSQGSQPLISFQNGRGDGTAIGNLLRYGLRTMCGIAAVCFTVLFLAAPKLVAVYLPEAGARHSTSDLRHGCIPALQPVLPAGGIQYLYCRLPYSHGAAAPGGKHLYRTGPHPPGQHSFAAGCGAGRQLHLVRAGNFGGAVPGPVGVFPAAAASDASGVCQG